MILGLFIAEKAVFIAAFVRLKGLENVFNRFAFLKIRRKMHGDTFIASGADDFCTVRFARPHK